MIKLSIELAYFATQFSPIEIKNTNRLDANLMTTAKAMKSDQRTLTIGGSIIVWQTSCLTGLNSTKQVKPMLIQRKNKAAKSKRNKQVSQTVILALKLEFSGLIISITSVKIIGFYPI